LCVYTFVTDEQDENNMPPPERGRHNNSNKNYNRDALNLK